MRSYLKLIENTEIDDPWDSFNKDMTGNPSKAQAVLDRYYNEMLLRSMLIGISLPDLIRVLSYIVDRDRRREAVRRVK